MNIWMKNTDGKRDAVLTMTIAGFVVILFKFLAAGIVLHLGERSIEFGAADAAAIGALLTPTLGAYVARRYTDKKYSVPPAQPSEPDVGEEKAS